MTDRTTEEARKAFIAVANDRGYDTAHAYDTDRSRWVFFNPMTADLWAFWQAALHWQAEQQKGEAWPAELSSSNRTQPVRFAVMDDEGLWIDDDDFIFDALIKVHGDFPDDEVKGKYLAEIVRRLNAANSLPQAPQGEQWISVHERLPELNADNEDDGVKVYTWDGEFVSEDVFAPEYEQPAGPAVGGWLRTGDWFCSDTATRVTHWMLRRQPAPPPLAQGDIQ